MEAVTLFLFSSDSARPDSPSCWIWDGRREGNSPQVDSSQSCEQINKQSGEKGAHSPRSCEAAHSPRAAVPSVDVQHHFTHPTLQTSHSPRVCRGLAWEGIF